MVPVDSIEEVDFAEEVDAVDQAFVFHASDQDLHARNPIDVQ